MVMSVAIVRSATVLATALNNSGQSMTEALGGFWSQNHGEPTFIPLDEFISQKFMEDIEGDLASHELVLETGEGVK